MEDLSKAKTLNAKKILKVMAPVLDAMSVDQLELLKNISLEMLRDKSIKEVNSPYVRTWSLAAQKGHADAYIRKAVKAEGKLNGEDAAERLKKKLYSFNQYKKLTPEEKEERMADYASLYDAYEDVYMDSRKPVAKAKWQGKKGSIYNNYEKENVIRKNPKEYY